MPDFQKGHPHRGVVAEPMRWVRLFSRATRRTSFRNGRQGMNWPSPTEVARRGSRRVFHKTKRCSSNMADVAFLQPRLEGERFFLVDDSMLSSGERAIRIRLPESNWRTLDSVDKSSCAAADARAETTVGLSLLVNALESNGALRSTRRRIPMKQGIFRPYASGSQPATTPTATSVARHEARTEAAFGAPFPAHGPERRAPLVFSPPRGSHPRHRRLAKTDGARGEASAERIVVAMKVTNARTGARCRHDDRTLACQRHTGALRYEREPARSPARSELSRIGRVFSTR